MQVTANGDVLTLDDAATAADLLTHLGLGAGWVLVERNGEPIERHLLASTALVEGDRIELVRAVAGG